MKYSNIFREHKYNWSPKSLSKCPKRGERVNAVWFTESEPESWRGPEIPHELILPVNAPEPMVSKANSGQEAEALCFPLRGDARSPVPLTKALVKPVCHHLRSPRLQLRVRENPLPDFPVTGVPPREHGPAGRDRAGCSAICWTPPGRAAAELTADSPEALGVPCLL